MNGRGPYILIQDNDSHWYVIPKVKEHAWNRWLESSDYGDGEPPLYSDAVGGAPSRVSFPSFTIE